MASDQNKLRAVVSRWSGGLQAQLLELDLAVQGADHDEIFKEFAHAITVSYEIAVAHGEAPFSSIGQPPKAIQDQFVCSKNKEITGWIPLKDEIAMALATALRWRLPKFSVMLEEPVPA
jgi:hypothetical protein